jgi:hypothetical protein
MGEAGSLAVKERFMNGLDVFFLSFCVAFIVTSDRFKMLIAGLVRRRR